MSPLVDIARHKPLTGTRFCWHRVGRRGRMEDSLMHRYLAPGFALLLLTACATPRPVTAPPERVVGNTTDDFHVSIQQTNNPLTELGHELVEVRYNITVKNRTAEPWTIERIALQSVGASGIFVVPASVQEFNRVITPGAEEQFDFRVTADVHTNATPSKVRPVTLSAKLYAAREDVKREEEFARQLYGNVSFGEGIRPASHGRR
jgi:hypothetical protein